MKGECLTVRLLDPSERLIVATTLEVMTKLRVKFGNRKCCAQGIDPFGNLNESLQMTLCISIPMLVVGNDCKALTESLRE